MSKQGDRNITERRRVVLRAAAGALVLPWAGGTAFAQQKIICRIAHSEAVGSPLSDAFEKWAGILRERSGGRIDAQHFPASQLGSYTQLIEQNRIGTIQVTTGGPDTEEAVAPEIAAAGGAPGFIYRDEAHVDRVLLGPIGEEISAIARRKTGVEFVTYGEVGFRHLLSKRPVPRMEDLKGLKIRTPGTAHLGGLLAQAGGQSHAAALRRAVLRAFHGRDRRAGGRLLLDPRLQVVRAGEEPDAHLPLVPAQGGARQRASGSTACHPTCRSSCATRRARCSPDSARPIVPRPTPRSPTCRRPA